MAQLQLIVSRYQSVTFELPKRVKHGKGKIVSRTNSLLLAKYVSLPQQAGVDIRNKPLYSSLRLFIDKKAGTSEQFELFETVNAYKEKNKIGGQFINGKLETAPFKKLQHPKQIASCKSNIEFTEVNNLLIQKIVKQLLQMHGAKIPANKQEYRELVNLKHSARVKNKDNKALIYDNSLSYKGKFWMSFFTADLTATNKDVNFQGVLKICGVDKEGNFVLPKPYLEKIRVFLRGQIATEL